LPDLSLIGIIDADSLFALPDFHTEEKALQILVQAIGRTARQSHRSTYHDRVLIQTFHPENPVFRTLQQGDLKPWYEATLDERSVLKYPPFRRFVLLQYRGRSSEDVDSSTQMVYDTLSRLDLGPSVRIDSPATPFIAKKRGFLSKNILIRLLPDTPIPTSLSDQLKRLSSGWSIDVDPVNIL
jgi:primosomal protein N' (replication factor Y)